MVEPLAVSLASGTSTLTLMIVVSPFAVFAFGMVKLEYRETPLAFIVFISVFGMLGSFWSFFIFSGGARAGGEEGEVCVLR